MAGFMNNGGGVLSALGGQQQQMPAWGGIFAALSDAGAAIDGRQGGSLMAFNQQRQGQEAQQHLMRALTSEDPAIRQQAYAYAALNNIPTDAIQKQQAAAALPKLLQSMQPSTQNVAPTQAALPNLPGQTVQGGGFNFDSPGMGLSEAVAASNSPELQQEWAPQIIKDQMERQAKQITPASAEWKKANGYSQNTPVFLDPNGSPTVKADPLAITPYQSAELKHQDAVFGETKRHNRVDEANAAPGEVDPQTVSYWAQSVAAGAPLPALGMGKQAALYRQAILKGAAQINNGQGLSGVDQNVNSATTKANTGALGKQTALRTATEGFENTMLQNMNVVRDVMKKGAGTTGVPIFNRYQQYLKGEYGGDPDVIALQNAIDTVADENAKIRSGTLGNTPATDAMRNNIKAGLNGSMTPDQIEKAFQVMERDAGNRSRSLRAQETAIKSGLRGKNDLPQIPGIREPQSQGLGAMPTNAASLPRLGGQHPPEIENLLKKYGK